MKKTFFALVIAIPLFLTLPGRSLSQTIALNDAPNRNVDYTRLARIDTLVNGYLEKGWLNGAVTIVIKDNQLIQYKGYGFSDLENKKPMRKDDLFRIASQTKALVSAGIMTLYEEGKFYLDEPISDFIPEFAHTAVLDTFNAKDSTYTTLPAKRGITFRDLLTHTSGIDYPGIGSDKMKAIYSKAGISSGLGVVDADLKERMRALARLPLIHQPGEKWTYSLSVDVLGCLIEVISGTDLEDYLAKKIFRPLGMKDTYFNVPVSKSGRLTTVYTEDSLHHIIKWTKAGRFGVDPDYPLVTKRYFSGGAGITSTAFDYAIFLQMMLNGGRYNGVQILSPRTVQLMTSGQLNFLYNGKDNFGLGFDITSERSAALDPQNAGSFSWGGFFGTTYWADPKAKLVCLIMTQQTPNSHSDYGKKFEQVVYQSLR